jgi:hypothetical protein
MRGRSLVHWKNAVYHWPDLPIFQQVVQPLQFVDGFTREGDDHPINGYPVYADRDEVADIITPLTTLRTDRANADLGVLLVDNRALRDRVEEIKFLYVPLEPTGCVFQTVQVMEQVRKGK